MRRLNREQIQQVRTRDIASEISLPAPFGGWNTVSSLAEMPEEDAVTLDNFYPDLGSVRVRFGFEGHATGVGAGLVQTVVEYNHANNRLLLAASSTNIYDATAAGAASSLLGSQSSGQWDTTMSIGNQLWVNGADTPQVFDGSSFSSWTGTGTGLTPASVIGCHTHRGRVYVWMANDSAFFYGDPSAIGGTFTKFEVGDALAIGGNIVAMKSWTRDGGSGPDDLLVIFYSSGQFVVYSGNNPSDSDFFGLVGVFHCGAPLGIRAAAKDGGDVSVITHEDIVYLTQTMASGDDAKQFTKVRKALAESVAGASSSFGWQVCQYPRGGMVIYNVPQAGGDIHQYVQNMATKAWCRYTGLEAQCWCVFDNELYFGGAGGEVFKAETGYTDDGETIQANALGAWTRLQIPNRKRIAAIRPLLRASQTEYNIGLGFDFMEPSVPAPSTITQTGTAWGSAWGSAWSQENTVSIGWDAASGTGVHVAMRLRVNAEASVEWLRTDLRIEPGRGL